MMSIIVPSHTSRGWLLTGVFLLSSMSEPAQAGQWDFFTTEDLQLRASNQLKRFSKRVYALGPTCASCFSVVKASPYPSMIVLSMRCVNLEFYTTYNGLT